MAQARAPRKVNAPLVPAVRSTPRHPPNQAERDEDLIETFTEALLLFFIRSPPEAPYEIRLSPARELRDSCFDGVRERVEELYEQGVLIATNRPPAAEPHAAEPPTSQPPTNKPPTTELPTAELSAVKPPTTVPPAAAPRTSAFPRPPPPSRPRNSGNPRGAGLCVRGMCHLASLSPQLTAAIYSCVLGQLASQLKQNYDGSTRVLADELPKQMNRSWTEVRGDLIVVVPVEHYHESLLLYLKCSSE